MVWRIKDSNQSGDWPLPRRRVEIGAGYASGRSSGSPYWNRQPQDCNDAGTKHDRRPKPEIRARRRNDPAGIGRTRTREGRDHRGA